MSTKDEQFTGYRTNHPDDLAHFASVRNFQDFLVDKANPVVMVTLTMDRAEHYYSFPSVWKCYLHF